MVYFKLLFLFPFMFGFPPLHLFRPSYVPFYPPFLANELPPNPFRIPFRMRIYALGGGEWGSMVGTWRMRAY